MKARQAMSHLAQAGSLGFYPPFFAQLGRMLGAFAPPASSPLSCMVRRHASDAGLVVVGAHFSNSLGHLQSCELAMIITSLCDGQAAKAQRGQLTFPGPHSLLITTPPANNICSVYVESPLLFLGTEIPPSYGLDFT